VSSKDRTPPPGDRASIGRSPSGRLAMKASHAVPPPSTASRGDRQYAPPSGIPQASTPAQIVPSLLGPIGFFIARPVPP